MEAKRFTLARMGWSLGGMALAILVLNPLMRLGLDAATCNPCGVDRCKQVALAVPHPTSAVPNATLRRFAPLPTAADGCADTLDGYNPCDDSALATVHRGNASEAALALAACRNALDVLGMSSDAKKTVAMHGIPPARLGRRWCIDDHVPGSATAATPTAGGGAAASSVPVGNATTMLTVCERTPWWGRVISYGASEWRTHGAGQSLLVGDCTVLLLLVAVCRISAFQSQGLLIKVHLLRGREIKYSGHLFA